MDLQELDTLFRTRTRREQYYLEHQGAPSPSYRTMEHRQIDGKDVLYFRLPALKEAEILIRKDSRFTDVPYYIHSNLNMNYIYSGKCDYVINSRSVTLHQGDVVIFDKDVVRRKQYAANRVSSPTSCCTCFPTTAIPIIIIWSSGPTTRR